MHGAAAQAPGPGGHDGSCARSRAWPSAALAAGPAIVPAPTTTPPAGTCAAIWGGYAARQQGRKLQGQPEDQAAEGQPQVGRIVHLFAYHAYNHSNLPS